jgi:hypothetical protein
MEQKIDEIHDEIVNSTSFLDIISSVGTLLGFYNSFLNRKQIDNNDIMNALNKQDTIYFKQIIKMLKEIKGEKNDDE